jgi:hypothetical protein
MPQANLARSQIQMHALVQIADSLQARSFRTWHGNKLGICMHLQFSSNHHSRIHSSQFANTFIFRFAQAGALHFERLIIQYEHSIWISAVYSGIAAKEKREN